MHSPNLYDFVNIVILTGILGNCYFNKLSQLYNNNYNYCSGVYYYCSDMLLLDVLKYNDNVTRCVK